MNPTISQYRDRRFKGSQEEFDHCLHTSTTLYIGNLSFYTTEEQILEVSVHRAAPCRNLASLLAGKVPVKAYTQLMSPDQMVEPWLQLALSVSSASEIRLQQPSAGPCFPSCCPSQWVAMSPVSARQAGLERQLLPSSELDVRFRTHNGLYHG